VVLTDPAPSGMNCEDKLCPRQDSNLRHRLLQPGVFDGSRLLSLAVVGQRFSASQRCRRLSLILADFRS
jgi:hypothetical protein